VVRFFSWSEVSHFLLAPPPPSWPQQLPQHPHYVELMTTTDVVSIRCANRARAAALYALLEKHAWRMRTPGYVRPLKEVLRELDEDESEQKPDSGSSSAGREQELLFGVETYRFGSANYLYNYYRKAPPTGPSAEDAVVALAADELELLSERMAQALARKLRGAGASEAHQHQNLRHHQLRGEDGGGSLQQSEAVPGAQQGEATDLIERDPSLKWRSVDSIAYHLVSDWQALSFASGTGAGGSSAGAGLRARGSRCVCLVLINGSKFPVQILRTELLYGKSLHTLGCFGYSNEARTLLPGGCVVFFVSADKPSLFGSGHAKACVTTAACSLTLSTRRVTLDSVWTPQGAVMAPPRDSEPRALPADGEPAVPTSPVQAARKGAARSVSDRVQVLEKTTSGDNWIKSVVLIRKNAADS